MKGRLQVCVVLYVLVLLGVIGIVLVSAIAPRDRKYVARSAEEAALLKKATNQENAREHERLKRNLETFRAGLKTNGVDAGLIAKISARHNKLTIVVQDPWHSVNKPIRLQAAQNLWMAWAQLSTPKDPNKSRIEIVDLNGNRVGGSGMQAGSQVDVKD